MAYMMFHLVAAAKGHVPQETKMHKNSSDRDFVCLGYVLKVSYLPQAKLAHSPPPPQLPQTDNITFR